MHQLGLKRLAPAALFLVVLAAQVVTAAASPEGKEAPRTWFRVPIVSDDYPDYSKDLGSVEFLGVDPEVAAQTDPRFHRLALADTEKVEYLPNGYWVYQTITTDLELPLNLDLIVNGSKKAVCFNPDIPYCTSFSHLNTLFREAQLTIHDTKEAGALARFVVDLGISSVFRPDNFIYLKLSQKMGVQFFNFLRNIEDIYEPSKAPFRSEARRQEVKTILDRYQDRVKPVVVEKQGKDFRLHGFTYTILQAGGPLREWEVIVHRNGTIEAQVKTLEKNIGELTWPFAP